MVPTQPFPRVTRTFRPDVFLRTLTKSCIVLVGLVLLFSGVAHAQGGVPLVTVATDQSSLDLSNQFGVPAGTAINQAGDFAFVGNGDTALFFRAAGASSATRLLQIHDPAPGFQGSEILSFLPELGMNSSRVLLFGVRFTGGDHLPHSALLTYDGANYHTVVSSDAIAPGGMTYGLNLYPGSIDDGGDVNFGAIPTTILATTYYIVPSGGTPVRILGLNDNPPPPCLGCFISGVPVGGGVISGPALSLFVPKLNSKGQMLFSLWNGLFIGSKDGTLSSVSVAASGTCSIQAGTSLLPSVGTGAFLNDSGAVAFTNPPNSAGSTICVAPAGGGMPTAAVASGDPAPVGVGGGTITSPIALGFDDSGEIVFQAAISGSNLTTFALIRFHPSNAPADVVAYDCEPAPGTNGSVFSSGLLSSSVSCGSAAIISLLSVTSPFEGLSIAQDGRVGFQASLANGKSAIYRQAGANAPEFISIESNGIPAPPVGLNIGTYSFNIFSANGQTEILNNGSVFFASYLTGASADFAASLGTPGNVQSLVSTADLLPAGAVTILGSTPPQAAGHFVAFTAQPAAGRINLLESDLTSGIITRVVTDNDPGFATAGGTPGNTVLASNYFLNESGQVAFEAVGANTGVSGIGVISLGSGATNSAWSESISRCGTIYLWSPSGGLKKVVTSGDPAPNSSLKFSCVTLNSGSPSPLNSSGQVSFTSPSPFGPPVPCSLCGIPNPAIGVNGVFLYSPGGTISEIAAANDRLPGETQATTFVPNLSVPTNSAGQIAFGAQLGATSQGFYLRNGTATQKVMANGDAVPGTSDLFGFPHFIAGLSDSGNLAFTAAPTPSGTTDGLFLATAGASIQTLALDGATAPGTSGGTFIFTPQAPVTPPGTFTVGINLFKNFASINAESDVAFGAAITGGSADSGYFRVLQSGVGTPQPVVLQGQLAPGGGTFNTINTLSSLGANFALGPDGALAFVNVITDVSGIKQGLFVARPDGALVKVAATGDFVPGGGEFAGLSISPRLAAGDAGKFVFLAGIAGGNARSAIFVTAIPLGIASTTTTLDPLQSLVVAGQSTTLTATVASATAGSPTGTVTFFANGISLGSGALSSGGQATLATSSLAAGPDSILAQYHGDSNFAAGNSAPLAAIVAGFAPPPANLTVTRGSNLAIPLTLFAPAGSNLNFTLSCSGLPANATCMFDTNPVTPGPSGTVVHLTFATMVGSNMFPIHLRKGHPPLLAVGLASLLAALFVAATILWRRAPRWRLVACTSLATFALALTVGGCGAVGYGSSAPVTPGTSTGPAAITITGTSGTTTISTVVNVTVQ